MREVETAETHGSADETYRKASAMLRRFPALKVIYVTDGSNPQHAARAIVESGREGRTVTACHDLTPETLEWIARGVIGGTLSQDPYAQGYDPIVHIYNHIVAGWEPAAPRILTRLRVVDRGNLGEFWDPERKQPRSPAAGKGLALAPISDSRPSTLP